MNIDLNELMQTSVDDLAQKQHDKLKEHAINVLRSVADCIKNEQYDEVKDLTFSSPAGDGYGLDSYVINFTWDKSDERSTVDILEIARKLRTLKEQSQLNEG